MKVQVDADKCQGHARCHALAPSLFDLDEQGHSVVKADRVLKELEELAREAVLNCPERAISISTE